MNAEFVKTYDFFADFTFAFVGDAVAAETAAPTELTDTPNTVANLLARYVWATGRMTALWTTAGVYGTPTMLPARAISKNI